MSYEALESEHSENSNDIPVDALKKLEGLELKDLNSLLTFNAISAGKEKADGDTEKLDAAFDALANYNVTASSAPPMRGIDRLNSININPNITSAMFAALAVSKSQKDINAGIDSSTAPSNAEVPDIWKNTDNVELANVKSGSSGKQPGDDERDQLLGVWIRMGIVYGVICLNTRRE